MFWIPYKEAKLRKLDLALGIRLSLLRRLRVTLFCFHSSDPPVSFGGFHGFGLYYLSHISFNIHPWFKTTKDLARQVGHFLEHLA